MCRFLGYLQSLLLDSPQALRLVVLGDFLDLSLIGRANVDQMTPSSRNAVLKERVDEILSAHGDVFAALKDFIEGGGTVDIIPGNSDGALRIPRIWEHLSQSLLRGCSTPSPFARVQLHPWIYQVPGVLYAEHGNQYHEINSFPALLEGFHEGGPQQIETIGCLLEAYGPRFNREAGGSRLDAWRWIAQLTNQYLRASKVRRASSYKVLIQHYAHQAHIPSSLALELDGLGSRAFWRSASRALTRSVIARSGRPIADSDRYLRDAALRVHRAAEKHHRPALFYVFGHTHLDDIAAMDGGASQYVNSGTWVTQFKRNRETSGRPYVHVTLGTEPSCDLFHWEQELVETSARP
jgi:hypothetical protein